MATYRERIRRAAESNGRIILACDYDGARESLAELALGSIADIHPYLCAIKLNMHLLLPLGADEVLGITDEAHAHGLQCIADIKLNDINSTNDVAARHLWEMGFDAVIATPIMGAESLKALAESASRAGKGVIALCHMSAPEALQAYEQKTSSGTPLYRLFLEWALEGGASGVVAGATFPDVIRYCSERAGGRLDVYSPGVGTQGGDADEAIRLGADYLIVGRTILSAADPSSAAADLCRKTR